MGSQQIGIQRCGFTTESYVLLHHWTEVIQTRMPNYRKTKSQNQNPHFGSLPMSAAMSLRDDVDACISVHSGTVGNLIVERKSRRILAMDSSAQTYFEVDSQEIGNISLLDLLPELNAQDANDLLDQNDKNPSKLISHSTNSQSLPKQLWITSSILTGEIQDALLLTLHIDPKDLSENRHQDALTGLADRRELARRFELLQGSNAVGIALLFLDLVRFKNINDHYGHPVGDQVLVELAARWRNCVRDQDLVVRYGGDEFVVLLENVSTPAAAQHIVDRLVESASQPITTGEASLQLEVTIGLALADGPKQSLAELIMAADRAMYAAKRSDK